MKKDLIPEGEEEREIVSFDEALVKKRRKRETKIRRVHRKIVGTHVRSSVSLFPLPNHISPRSTLIKSSLFFLKNENSRHLYSQILVRISNGGCEEMERDLHEARQAEAQGLPRRFLGASQGNQQGNPRINNIYSENLMIFLLIFFIFCSTFLLV